MSKKIDQSRPAPVRPSLAVLFQITLILAVGAFGILTFLVKTTPAFALDLQVTRTIQLIDLPGFAGLMSVISWPGFSPQAAIITALIVVLMYGLGLHWESSVALSAAASSTGLNLLVKELVQRPRPAADTVNVVELLKSYSFPSGHVMYYLGFWGFIGFLVFCWPRPSLKRSLFLLMLGLPISLIGVSRIYLGEHWASDVLGSNLLGSLVLVANIQLYRWGQTRFFIHPPMALEGGSSASAVPK